MPKSTTSRRAGAGLVLLCLAVLAFAGTLHFHPVGFEGASRLELRPQQRVVAVDPCVACLLARNLVAPGFTPALLAPSLPPAGVAAGQEASVPLVSFNTPASGRSPPHLLAARA